MFALLLAAALAASPPLASCYEDGAVEGVAFDVSGSLWRSSYSWPDGTPQCWGSRFFPGDVLRWQVRPPCDPAVSGVYRVVGVSFDAAYAAWEMEVDPPAPVQAWGGCCACIGTLVHLDVEEIFSDGFESGDVRAWD